MQFLRAAAADQPEADSGQDDGQTEEDRRFVPLEGPVAAGGLIRHGLLQVKPGNVGVAGLAEPVVQAWVAGSLEAGRPAGVTIWLE